MSQYRFRARRAVTLGALAATLLTSVRAQAQQTTLSINAGTATDQRGARSSAIALSPGLVVTTANDLSLALGANATRFQSGALSLGGNAGLFTQQPVAGPLAFTLDAAATYSRLQEQGVATFAYAEALPGAQLRFGSVALFGAWRAAAGRSTETVPRSLPFAPGGSAAQGRSAAGPSMGAVWTPAAEGAAMQLTVRHDRYAVDGAAVRDMLAAASVSWSRVALHGNVGRRVAPDERLGIGGAGLSVTLRPGVALEVGAGRYASNRVTGTPAGSYMNVGLSLRGGRARALERDVRVPGAPPVRPGYTRFAIDARDATTVELAGDFTEWKTVSATRVATGTWYADVRVGPGQYRYAFRIDGSEWRVPRGATAVDDGFGGKSAWITIGDSRARQETSRRQ